MALNISQNDYNVIQQKIIKKYIRLDLLDFNYNVVNEISGDLTNLSVSVNADSDLRRSCSVSLVVRDSSYNLVSGGQIWLDKFIQPYIGYENIYTGEVQWYNQGIYLINAPTWNYDALTNTLSFEGLDLMSKMTGVRNGQLPGVPTVVPSGSNVRNAIISAIQLAGFTKYVVNNCTLEDGTVQTVPYDIEVAQGGTIYSLLTELRDILPQYQMYFDIDGVFHYDKIPSGTDDPILMDDNLIEQIKLSESVSADFQSVKNLVEVYGRSHDVQYFATDVSITSGSTTIVNLTCTGISLSPLPKNVLIGVVLPQAITNASVIRFSFYDGTSAHGQADLWTFSGEPSTGGGGSQVQYPYQTSLEGNTYLVVGFDSSGNLRYYGHQQAYGEYSDDNPDSPFYINGTTGTIRYVCSGGEYDNIVSDELALERAKLEIYWRCRLNDTITLNTIPIPWLDVNILISHTPVNSTETNEYMIKSFSADYGDSNSMSITAARFYPYYPFP